MEQQREKLEETIEAEEILTALKLSNNSSAPGPDGIPYKFWKSFNNQFINNAKQNQRGGTQKTTCDIIELLTMLYEDPGRRIMDQTKLIRMMIQYTEAREQNGIIVALD